MSEGIEKYLMELRIKVDVDFRELVEWKIVEDGKIYE